MVAQSGVEKPVSREELLRRARELVPALKERAAAAEAATKVPEESMRDIVDAELIRIGTPVRYGGFDVEIELMNEVSIELARGCPSTAWCYVLWALHGYWMPFWGVEAQEELFADGPDLRTSSAQLSVRSHYERVPGGYRVSGHGKFASGCDHAQWLFALAMGPEGPLQVIVRQSEFQVVDGSWDVSGLRGTGSKDVVIEDVFVPDHRARRPPPPLDLDPQSEKLPYDEHPQRRYAVPLSAIQGWDLPSVAVGAAQGAVDSMTERLHGSTGPMRSAQSPIVQGWIAESAAEVDAARALMHSDFEDAQTKGDRGEPVTALDLARYLRNRSLGFRLSVDATNRVFELGGARSLSMRDPLQRFHRDVHAASHGPLGSIAFVSQFYGRMVLGLPAFDAPPP